MTIRSAEAIACTSSQCSQASWNSSLIFCICECGAVNTHTECLVGQVLDLVACKCANLGEPVSNSVVVDYPDLSPTHAPPAQPPTAQRPPAQKPNGCWCNFIENFFIEAKLRFIENHPVWVDFWINRSEASIEVYET